MTVVSVAGHMDLTEHSEGLIREAIMADLKQLLSSSDKITGVSCIAKGADTLFAESIVELGCDLVIIVPSLDYRENKVKPDHAPAFDRLVNAAAEVMTLPNETANRDAYEKANLELLERADILYAIWDGTPATGKGSTGDTVLAANEKGLPVNIIWPTGAERSRK